MAPPPGEREFEEIADLLEHVVAEGLPAAGAPWKRGPWTARLVDARGYRSARVEVFRDDRSPGTTHEARDRAFEAIQVPFRWGERVFTQRWGPPDVTPATWSSFDPQAGAGMLAFLFTQSATSRTCAWDRGRGLWTWVGIHLRDPDAPFELCAGVAKLRDEDRA